MVSVAEIDELFAASITGDFDREEQWNAIYKLQDIATREVFDKAVSFCQSSNSEKCCRGLAVLAQFGVNAGTAHGFKDEIVAVVKDVLRKDNSSNIVCSALAALGHIKDPNSIDLVGLLLNNPAPEVRHSVAAALGGFADSEQGVEMLLCLMNDSDGSVRDWATFGLGVQGVRDSVEIRNALFKALSDTHLEAQTEAMLGLARRSDLRVLPHLINFFEEGWMGSPAIDAAILILKLEKEPEGWAPSDYAKALRKVLVD